MKRESTIDIQSINSQINFIDHFSLDLNTEYKARAIITCSCCQWQVNKVKLHYNGCRAMFLKRRFYLTNHFAAARLLFISLYLSLDA